VKKGRSSTPCPGSYDPRYSLVEQSKFNNISFGKGDRPDSSYAYKSNLMNPGPGEYLIPSIADLVARKVSY